MLGEFIVVDVSLCPSKFYTQTVTPGVYLNTIVNWSYFGRFLAGNVNLIQINVFKGTSPHHPESSH